MTELIRRTRSLCPVCLKPLEAELRQRRETGEVFLTKTCPAHGAFTVPVWRGRIDFAAWTAGAKPLGSGEGLHCPSNCGICPEHGRATCCALLEVTRRCNLYCRYCFAHGGETDAEPSLEQLKAAVDGILRQCGNPLLQLSGGEPSLRDDLPELAAYARERGCPAVQINTNGLRLASDPDYVRRLAEAGLDIVFLQFDGVTDEVYRTLRGRELLDIKLRAIENCGRERIGVTLVPTVVRGVNDKSLGEIIRLGASLSPAVRGVHFQPVSHFGRYPAAPGDDMRYTLDELIDGICRQTGLPEDCFQPSCCDHPLCGFHVSALAEPCCCGDAAPAPAEPCCCGVTPLPPAPPTPRKGQSAAEENRNYVIRRWRRSLSPEEEAPGSMSMGDAQDLDSFLRLVRTRSFTLTAMAFQDAWNLDIERLRSCSLHVYSEGKVKPFCANYLTAARTESEVPAPPR